MEECRANKNWAYFYKIEGIKNESYQKNGNNKSYCPNPIFLQENYFCKNQVTVKIVWKV